MIRRPPRSTQSRSRGLGDVYKRQPYLCPMQPTRSIGGRGSLLLVSLSISSIVSIPSSHASWMNPQVLTIITWDASSVLVCLSPSLESSLIKRSDSTSLRKQPSVTTQKDFPRSSPRRESDGLLLISQR